MKNLSKKAATAILGFGMGIMSFSNSAFSQCPTGITIKNPRTNKPDTFKVDWSGGKPTKSNPSNKLYLEIQKGKSQGNIYDIQLVQDDTLMINEAKYIYNQNKKIKNLNNPGKNWTSKKVKELSNGSLNTLESSCNQPLPIELMEFEAKTKGNKAIFEWSTASETNNDYFEIQTKNPQKNTGWISRKSIDSKAPEGTSNLLLEYKTTIEFNNASEDIYTRLKQVDIGKKDSSYSNIEKISFEQENQNPTYNIYNTKGKELYEGKIEDFLKNSESKEEKLYIGIPENKNLEPKKFYIL